MCERLMIRNCSDCFTTGLDKELSSVDAYGKHNTADLSRNFCRSSLKISEYNQYKDAQLPYKYQMNRL